MNIWLTSPTVKSVDFDVVTRITSVGNNFKFGLQIQNFLAIQNNVVTANLASETDAKHDSTFAYTYSESSASLLAI